MTTGSKGKLEARQRHDFYQILGVELSSSSAVIKQTYRKLVLRCHPDKVPEVDRAKATERFHLIQQAYDVLSREDLRRDYDRQAVARVPRPKAEARPRAEAQREAMRFSEAIRFKAIHHGVTLKTTICACVFESPASWKIMRKVEEASKITVSGRAWSCDGDVMVPVEPDGWIDITDLAFLDGRRVIADPEGLIQNPQKGAASPEGPRVSLEAGSRGLMSSWIAQLTHSTSKARECDVPTSKFTDIIGTIFG